MPQNIRTVLIGLVIVAVSAWLWLGQTRWRGMVVDDKGAPIEGVTVMLVNGGKVADITATDATGKYSFVAGMRPDPALRVVFCKTMYEPSPLYERGSSQSAKYTIELARADFTDPGVEKILAGLPPECQ